MTSARRIFMLISSAVLVGLLSGCSTARIPNFSGAIVDATPAVYLPPSEFEYVYVTGSRVPVRVLKNAPKGALPDTASHVVARSPAAFESIVNAGLNTGR